MRGNFLTRLLATKSADTSLRTSCKSVQLTNKTKLTDGFLFNKTNRRTNFPNLCLSRNSTCFGQFLCPSSGVFHCTFGTGICVCHQTCMTYTSAECTVEISWGWTEELPETCRVSWQKYIWEISLLRYTVTWTSKTNRRIFSFSWGIRFAYRGVCLLWVVESPQLR